MLEFIVLYPRCGLGNRLRAMACAYALSKRENCPLYINWEPAPDCFVAWGDVFDTSLFPMPSITMDEVASKYPNRKVFYNDRTHTDIFLLSECQSSTPQYQGIIISGGHDFKHPHMSENELLYLKHTYYQMLIRHLRIELLEEITNISVNVSSMIGVHVRMFVKEFDTADQYDFENDTVLEVTVRMMNQALLRNPNATFLVSCNEESCATSMRNIFGSQKIFAYDGKYSQHEQRNTIQGIQNAFINLVLLSQTRLILGTYRSSFSDEAAIMGMITKVCTSDRPHDQPYHCYGHLLQDHKSYILYSQPTIAKHLALS